MSDQKVVNLKVRFRLSEKDSPLVGHKINLLDHNRKPIAERITDFDGVIEFYELVAGVYFFEIDIDGFITIKGPYTIEPALDFMEIFVEEDKSISQKKMRDTDFEKVRGMPDQPAPPDPGEPEDLEKKDRVYKKKHIRRKVRKSLDDRESKEMHHIDFQVFYATNRKGEACETKGFEFGPERGKLSFGVCTVSIPEGHTMGEIERPKGFLIKLRENPDKHIVLESVTPLKKDEFEASLKSHINRADNKQGLLFIHGFNTSFEEAAQRSGQMAYDLGIITSLMFSWPSKGELTPFGYTYDENNARWTVEDFKKFIQMIATKSGLLKLHVVAHSMGNRALTGALSRIANEYDSTAGPLINEVVLAAPDIDADTFKRDILPRIAGSAERISLYASAHDKALQFSKTVHGYPRAGNSADGIVVDDSIDTIDVSPLKTGFFHHNYFAEDRNVISDISMLIKNSLSPKDRNLLKKRCLAGIYWKFRK